MDEARNEMKMCLLCKQPEGGYSDLDVKLHKFFGIHVTERGHSYRPSPTSSEGKYHAYICKLFNLGNGVRISN